MNRVPPVPVTLIHGDADTTATGAFPAVPGEKRAELVVLPGIGHFERSTRAAETLAAIQRTRVSATRVSGGSCTRDVGVARARRQHLDPQLAGRGVVVDASAVYAPTQVLTSGSCPSEVTCA